MSVYTAGSGTRRCTRAPVAFLPILLPLSMALAVCGWITGCGEPSTEVAPLPLEVLEGLRVSQRIEDADVEYIRRHLDGLREDGANVSAPEVLTLFLNRDSVAGLEDEEREALMRALAYLLQNADSVSSVADGAGGMSGPAHRLFTDGVLDGVRGHYYLASPCTTTFGNKPPVYISEWFLTSCPATNGTVCNMTTPRTYTLYWCDD